MASTELSNFALENSVFGIDDAVAARESQSRTEWELRTLVEGMPQLVWRSCERGLWTWASPQWLAFTGQMQAASHGHGWLDVVHPDDHAAALEAWDEARPHGALDVEFRVLRATDGAYIWHRTRSAPIWSATGEIVEWLGTTSDINDLKLLQAEQVTLLDQARQHGIRMQDEIRERKRAEDKLVHAAYHDELTGQHNRAFFMGDLKRALAALRPGPDNRDAVLVLDLDRFKAVNDSLGHTAGDTLLRVLGQRVRACLAPGDTLARLGGDEFGIIARSLSSAGLEDRAAQLLSAVRRPVSFGRRQIVSSASLGSTWISESRLSPEDLLQEADTAMYEVKRGREGGFRPFAEPMRVSAINTLDLRNDLRHAVERSELELHYQPIWGTASNLVVGFEALVRWQNPRLGLLQPGDFIPLAEESGMIRGIGRWVLQEGCAQLARWRTMFPDRELTLNVNVCSEELTHLDFVPFLQATLAATCVEPRQLELEITESMFLGHSEAVLDMLQTMRRLGVRIAIDDFGTGFSSLSYLDRHEIDTVKIDRSFVSRMLTETRTRAIMEAVLGLGRALSLRVVAEGVEVTDQRDALRDMRCDAMQGYLTGRPSTAEDATKLLAES